VASITEPLFYKKIQIQKEKCTMAKSRTEKIASYDEQIAMLQKKRNEELDKQKQEEKDEREKRQRKRGEILEKMIPETVDLTIEQFTTFLRRSTANPFGRDKLAEIIKEGEAKPKPQAIPTPPQSSPTNEKLTPQQPQSLPNGKPTAQPQSLSHEKPTPPTNADERKN